MRGEVGHDDFPGLAGRKNLPDWIDDLDNDVLGADVHSAIGTLVGDDPVSAAVAVGYAGPECLRDLSPLVIVQALGRHKCHLDTKVVHSLSHGLRVARNMRKRGRVPEDHSRSHNPDRVDKLVELCRGHLKGREQPRPKQSVTEARSRSCAPSSIGEPQTTISGSPISTPHHRVARHFAATSWLIRSFPM